MRNPNRIKPFLEKFEKLWNENPDFRFGQLVTIIASEMGYSDIFFPEENQWEKQIEKMYMK